MCGIVAFASTERGAITRERMDRAAAALAHRGPDGRGIAIYDDGRSALAHTRLAIVDVAGGAQPVANEDGTISCVVSGELYDDARIRTELEARGHRFRTRSDSELVVHLYEEHGDAFVAHLRGEFALAIWDARRKRLLCARDRFGVRPLVWTELDSGIAVASEAKALFALGARRRWDADTLWLSMCAQYATPDRTVFAGVRQLPAGHVLVVDDGGARTTRYWDFDLPRTRDARTTPTDLVRALDDAVRVRMRIDGGRVACALSGGIDSSTIAALAARHQDGLECFSLSFADDAYDEVAIAKRTAAHVGATCHPVRVSASALWEALPSAVAQSEGLAINTHVAAKWILAREVKRAGYKVILTGEGADEVLLGYPHFRRDLLLARGEVADDLARRNAASAGSMMPAGDMLDTSAFARVLGFVPTFVEAKAALGFRASSLLARDFVSCFSARDPFGEIMASLDVEQMRDRERVDQSAYAWSKLALAGYILRTLGDGTEMAHAVEGRVPFLDHRFFEVARGVPTSDKVRGEIEKWILREGVRTLVPEEVIARRKHPLLAPPLASRLAEARELLRSSALPAFFDAHAIATAFDRLDTATDAERTVWDPPLMLAITATLLAKRYDLEDP